MPKPLGLGLRRRIIESFESGENDKKELAKRFMVSLKTVYNYINLHQKTGQIEPKPHSGGQGNKKLFEEHYEALEGWIDEEPDIYWQELADKLLEVHGVKVHHATICRQMRARGYTQKKRRSATRR